MIPTYPEYIYRKTGETPHEGIYVYEFRTRLRTLYDDGKYYLSLIVYRVYAKDFEQAVKMFIHESYIHVKFTKVSPEFIAPDGNPLFILDPDQRSELERLKLVP